MIYLILAIVALGVVAAIIGLWQKGDDVVKSDAPSCSTCSGQDERCEQECMLEAASREIEYYDDEELDKYAGRTGDSYSEAEVEEFSNVLYTLRPDDVKGWNRSLILRQIALPDSLRDELIMMMGDR